MVPQFAIQVRTGKYVDLRDPHPNTISVADIAYGLARINRFVGHTKFPYSVAQHSILVSRMLPKRLKLAGLFHDSAEFIMGDISHPLKSLLKAEVPGFEGYWRTLEDRAERAILAAIGHHELHEYLHNKEVKHADLRALATERRDLMPDDDEDWRILQGVEPDPDPIRAMNPDEVTVAFLDRFSDLTGGWRG